MDEKVQKVLMSSDNEHWNTPDDVLTPIREHLGPIVLDPCSNPFSKVRAKTEFFGPPGKDGLAESWQAGGVVYVNPPYGRKIVHWVDKAVLEGEASKILASGTEIVMLVPARTDTVWFHKILATANTVLLWKGRLTFLGAPHGAPFPSAIAYWGHRPTKFKVAFVDKGWSFNP